MPADDIYRQLFDPDRFIRWAARIALERTPRADWAGRVLKETNTLGVMEGLLAWVRTAHGAPLAPALEKQFALMRQTGLSVDDQLRLLRVFPYTITELPSRISISPSIRRVRAVDERFPAPTIAEPEIASRWPTRNTPRPPRRFWPPCSGR